MVTDKIHKEKQVIELYKQDKTIREIAQDVHMSFGDISKIIKKFTGEDNVGKEKTISKDTQAIKLFSQGKTPVDVVIELDIPTDEANRIYRDFWKLKRLYQLNIIYDEIKNDMPSFLKLFRMIKDKGIAEKDIIGLFQYSNQIPSLGRIVQSLYKKINVLTQQKDIATS